MTAIYKDVTSLLFEVSGPNDMVLTQRAGRQTLQKLPVRALKRSRRLKRGAGGRLGQSAAEETAFEAVWRTYFLKQKPFDANGN